MQIIIAIGRAFKVFDPESCLIHVYLCRPILIGCRQSLFLYSRWQIVSYETLYVNVQLETEV